MRKISDTIARLAAIKAMPSMPAIGPDPLADFTDFGSNPGDLNARVFIPAELPAGAPLVVVLHGCTQSAHGYDRGAGWSELAEREGFALLFPEQRRQNNQNLCFNWFEPEDIRRDGGEALSIRQMIGAMIVRHRLDPRRVFVTGLSAGGAMAAVLLATYPELFAGGAIIAGLPFGTASTVPEAFDRMRGHGIPSARRLQGLLGAASDHHGDWPRLSVWHGSADRTVVASNADAIVDQWLAAHRVDAGDARHSSIDGHSRTVWLDARGRSVIEKIVVEGMGHGTPLAASGPEGLGVAGPFMIEVGLSSTLHIAHAWGLAGQPSPSIRRRPVQRDAKQGIGGVIEDALRTAGLLR